MSSPVPTPADPEPQTDWTPPAPEELAPDFPGLEIESLLAQGGMSAVYLARQRSLDRRVVLKVLPVEVGKDPDAADRFMREARVLAKLRDPGIVEIYDSGLSPGGHLFLVLEWEEGGDLRHWAQNEVALEEALGIGESVCAALSAAHAESIIHGDIKPDNIFIDGKGRLKVGDFGLADFGGEKRAVFHTPGYTAPEIIYGEGCPSVQSDCYAAAAMVFELIYRSVPSITPEERSAALVSLPPAASRALGQMLTDDPAKRPVTAEACRKLLAEARRALNSVPAPRRASPPRPVATTFTPSPARSSRRTARTRTENRADSGNAGKWVAAAAVLVIGGGTLKLLNKPSADADEDTGNRQTTLATPAVSPSAAKPAADTPGEHSGLFDFPDKEKPTVSKNTGSAQKTPTTPASAASVVAVAPAEPATPIDPALVPLRKKYSTALANAVKAAEQAKEVTKVLALRSELTLLEKGGAPPDLDEPGIPSDLAKLRGIYRREAAALTPAAVVPARPASSGKPPLGMPADAVPFNGKWYRFYSECPTWHAARDKCSNLGGMLAVVPDQTTWTFIKGMIGNKWTWLGATDEKSEGVWTWLDGSPMTLSKWQKGEPNNRDAKEHYLRASTKGWRDDAKQSGEVAGFLCEWRPK